MLRAHALWAGRRLGLVDVVESVRDDDDPVVRAEWNVLVNRRTV
jgi:hypothetical protein